MLHWPSRDKHAAILLVHGHGEHIGRYQRLVTALSDLPVDFIGYDQVGHGESDGPRGDAEGMDALAADLAAFVSFAKEQTRCERIILFGHSMGAVVTARVLTTLTDDEPAVAGVLSAPAFVVPKTPLTRLKIGVGRILARVAPRVTFGTGLDASRISRDPDIARKYQTDPLVHNRISARLGKSLIDIGEACIRDAGQCTLPLLVYHGTADQIADINGTRRFVAGADPLRVDYRELEGFYHEPHNEPLAEAQKVHAMLRHWFDHWLQ